jgi:hypothetical protein
MALTRKRIHVDVDLVDPPERVDVYRTARRGLSSDDQRQELQRRWEHWRGVFAVDGEPDNLGDRLVVLSASTSLEVYLASDSVWWTDRSRAYRETPEDDGVPEDLEAVRLAETYIAETFQPALDLSTVSVGEQVAATSQGPRDAPRSDRLGVAVTLRPTLSDRPIFGPGAKVRVLFTDSSRPADVAYFSRQVEHEGEVEAVHPYQALERLIGDRRFAEALAAGLEFHVRRFEFGYYSAPPDMFQQFLVPVYLAEGDLERSQLDADVFRLYVPAVDIDARSMKALGVRANPTVRSTFTSF